MSSYSNSTPSNNVMFNGKGDVDAFIAKVELYNKLKKYEGEEAAALLASRLEGFKCLRLSSDDKKEFTKLKDELLKQFQTGNRNREEALSLLGACQRNEGESAQDFAYRISRLVRISSDAQRQVHEKTVFASHQGDITATWKGRIKPS